MTFKRPASLRVSSSPSDVRKAFPKSRRQFVTLPMPDFVEPQLATLVDNAPRTGFVHEVKFDGYRMQARIESGAVVLRTREAHDWTDRFPEIALAAVGLPDCIVDGEICALDGDGMPRFAPLQQAIAKRKTAGLVFFAFDLIFDGPSDLRTSALQTRKYVLRRHIDTLANDRVRYVDHVQAEGEALFQASCRAGMEGIVSKRLDDAYKSGRAGQW